jgi:hypothetical protein
MAAVPEFGVAAEPATLAISRRTAAQVHRTRLVAVAVTPMELLRPESDLARLMQGAEEIDLLIASEDVPGSGHGAVGSLGHPDYDDLDDADDDEPAADDVDEVLAGAARLGLPDLQLHRLGLRPPLGPQAEGDLVAALSELVGFDPEPGVYCLAPARALADPARLAVDRAAQRIARVYGIPLVRYRCLELSVVGHAG